MFDSQVQHTVPCRPMFKTDVIAHFGSPNAAAAAIGVTKSAVSQWKELIPRGIAYKVQVITGGKMQVNPTLYPPKKKPISSDPRMAAA